MPKRVSLFVRNTARPKVREAQLHGGLGVVFDKRSHLRMAYAPLFVDVEGFENLEPVSQGKFGI